MSNLIGFGVNQIPTNGMLGNLAFQDKAYVSVDRIGIGTTFVDSGTSNQILQVYGGGAYVSGNLGVGNTNPGATLHVTPTSTSIAGLFSGSTSDDMVRITQTGSGNAFVVEDSTNPDASPFVIDTLGDVGIGTTNPTSKLHIGAATTSAANNSPLKLTSGGTANLLVTPEVGAIEYDGNVMYATSDTTSGRGFIPTTQIYRLTGDGSAIGPGISSYFGATGTAINMVAGGVYRLEAFLWFTKTTNGTFTLTLTTSQNAVNIDGIMMYGPNAGGTSPGTAQRTPLFKSATTANAFAVTGANLTGGANHAFNIDAIIEANASLASTLRIDVTQSAGTVTPLRGSYYVVTRLPSSNQGVYTTL